MPIWLEGGLIGVVLGIVLTTFEWYMLSKEVKIRGERLHKKIELDVMEKRRINTVMRFSLLLPFAFALGFWIVWG